MSKLPDFSKEHCSSKKGGSALSLSRIREYLAAISNWQISPNQKRIRRRWVVKDFLTALDFFRRIARIAQVEDHHPDLHLRGYRNVTVELSTHDVDGLTENDFIIAAKIDRLPIELKKPKA